jgi:hypothetical protein
MAQAQVQTQTAQAQIMEALNVVLREVKDGRGPRTPTVPLKDFKPPNYSGEKDAETLDTWAFQMALYFDLIPGLSEAQRVHLASLNLRGQAADWYRGLSIHDQKPATWEALQEGLRSVFLPMTRDKLARDKLSRVRQRDNEGVSSYTSYIRRLFLAIPGISEDEKVDRYMRGLTPSIRKEVFIKEPTTFEEAARLAARYDALSNFGRRYSNHPPKSEGPTPMELGAVQNDGRGKFKQAKGKGGAKQGRGPADTSERRCWACNEKGHYKKDCPHRHKTPSSR